ncbi:hypothetical protein L7F22_062588 [Adiantum nelumboides]|nr:hypothetical protein [Adiantum nelumboides]
MMPDPLRLEWKHQCPKPRTMQARNRLERSSHQRKIHPPSLHTYVPCRPVSSTPSEMDEREKARDARIQAAKDRAKELRAGLNPVSVQQLESRKESAKVAPVLLTPTKSAEIVNATHPVTKVVGSLAERKSLSPKDDPFAKDRFSGRVASVASKFGGAGAKQLTPQSTGNSLPPSSPATSPSSTSVAPAVASQKYPPSLPAEASTMDPNEPFVRKSSESSNAVGTAGKARCNLQASETYAKEYKSAEREEIRLRRLAKSKGDFYVPAQAKVAFVVRLRGISNIAPKPRKILQLLRLLQINNGVFVRLTKATQQMLQLVEPYVTYGQPNLKTVRELVYKRGYAKINRQRIPLSDNSLVEQQLGKFGIISVEDLVHEIYTVGPHFKEANQFLWTFKLSNPNGGFADTKFRHFVEGGDTGDREHDINRLVRRMN